MDGEVQAHELGQGLVVVAQHASEVGGPIELWVDGSNALSVTVSVTVDGGSDDWELGNEIHAVLIGVFPVFALVNTLNVTMNGENAIR